MKRSLALLTALLLCLCLLLPSGVARADLGDFSGGGDYGDYGDSDWSSSYDDDDGGYYFFPVGSSDSGSGGSGSSWLIALIVVIIIVYALRKKNTPAASAGRAAGAARTPAEKLSPMREYEALDPQFSQEDMRQKLSNLYVQMQNCCTARDLEPLRPYFADPLYQQFDRQIQALRRNRQINHVDRIAVLEVNLRGFFQENGEDHLVAELKTRITDYTVSEDTGKILSGSNTAEKFMTYEWNLSRPSHVQTAAEAAVTNRHCPNCGAPLSVNQSARCPYCDSVITFADHDWTIYAIKGVAQRTVQS